MNLNNDDLNRVVRFIPRDVRELMKTHNLFLAGGAIRSIVANEEIRDFDLFGSSRASLSAAASDLEHTRKGVKVHKTDNAITLVSPGRAPVQFITRWTYDSAEPLTDNFDFTVCSAVVWYGVIESGGMFALDKMGWQSYVQPGFYEDLAAKRLRYSARPASRDDAPGGSILRVQKMLKRGYDISPESLGAVIARLFEGIDTGSTLWNDGEAARARIVTGLLREVDPLSVIDGIEAASDDDELN